MSYFYEADFKARKEKALNSLVGAVMKKTRGRADARTAREMLLGRLSDYGFSKFESAEYSAACIGNIEDTSRLDICSRNPG